MKQIFYEQSLDAPKSILETGKTLKTLSSGQIYKIKTQKNKKPTKPEKTKKKTLGWFFLNKPGFFPTLGQGSAAAPAAFQRHPLHQGGVCGGCSGKQRHLCAAAAPPVPPLPPGHGEPAPAGRSYA